MAGKLFCILVRLLWSYVSLVDKFSLSTKLKSRLIFQVKFQIQAELDFWKLVVYEILFI